RDLPANLNFFAYLPVENDGTAAFADGKSKPGDYVDLSAQRDVLVVISNCPQLYNPCNGWNPTPIRVIEWKPAAACSRSFRRHAEDRSPDVPCTTMATGYPCPVAAFVVPGSHQPLRTCQAR